MERRDFLTRTGLVFGAAVMARANIARASQQQQPGTPALQPPPHDPPPNDWPSVRAQFALDPDLVHMAGFYLASHPKCVRDAIERYRAALDANPIGYQHALGGEREVAVYTAAGRYLGARPDDIALTDSTTMGLALMYGTLELTEGQDILSTTHDHYSTYTSLRWRAERAPGIPGAPGVPGGSKLQQIPLYENSSAANADEIVSRITRAVTASTRVLAVTWVHSSTGVKLPLRAIADALGEINRSRDAKDRIIFCVDGVHGLGIDDVTIPELGCDFFAAGTHKWIFGPRGTGILWARAEAQELLPPSIPPFNFAFDATKRTGAPPWGMVHTPGGFHSFEHRWALNEAFDFHMRIGKRRVQDRIHQLNRQLKEGLAGMNHVTLHTPMSDDLSAGIVCFMVARMTPRQVVDRLAEKKIVASVSPYAVSYARLAPSLLVTSEQVDIALREVRALA